jgi:hypothetical protein
MESMMAVTLRQRESIPDEYPEAPDNLSAAAQAIVTAVWQRIESYVAQRWTERDVTWIVEGPGEWVPPLSPATISTIEVWTNVGEWEAAELSASPLGGYFLPGVGLYRIKATVGGGDVPEAVSEAFKRLAEYMATKPGKAGAASEGISAGTISLSHRRSASWRAEAMSNSGAGDLLRPYRRAA